MLATTREANSSSRLDSSVEDRYAPEISSSSSKPSLLHPLRRFYRSKSSERSTPTTTSKGKDNKSDKKKRKKKSTTNGDVNESINLSSASSSGYNSHIIPGETNFSHQHLYQPHEHPHNHHHHHHLQQQQPPEHKFQNHHPTTTTDNLDHGAQLASLPVLDSSFYARPAPPVRSQQQSWQRSMSLRAPMVPMMIDDEIDLIDDNIEADESANHHHQQSTQQQHYPNPEHHHHQQQQPHHNRQYQHHQRQFLLTDEETEQGEHCVDASYHHHSLYHHQQQPLPEPPQVPLQQQQHYYGPRSVGHNVADDDDDGGGRGDDVEYSQVRRSSDINQEDFVERISHLQLKQQQQMMLASALRSHHHHHQYQSTTGQRSGLNSKSTFSLAAPHHKSSTAFNSSSKFPVAIYHQPNLNFHNHRPQQQQQQYHQYSTSGNSLPYQQQPIRDLQRRFQPTPFSQIAPNSISYTPSISGPRSLQPDRKQSRGATSKQQLSSGSSAGSQSATDSGAALACDQPSTSSSNLSALTASSQRKLNGSRLNFSHQEETTTKMQQSSGNRQHNQHSSRIKSPAPSQSSRRKPGSGSPPPPQVAQERDGRHLKLAFCGKFAKLLLFISNILFWAAGIALGAWGIMSLVDDHKYNLSHLLVFEPNSKMSLFQLLSWSFITLGCATILVGFCGCSAIFKNNRWILGLYIFLILAIFALDLATGLLAMIFQERLVANVRLRLANKLRSDYGVQASFTAAIDYIQTRYECCGLEGHFDYDQSLWRLQRLGGFEATVARTCCHLRNTFDDQAHVNPRPVNESMCQSSDIRFHQSYRYRKGCLDDLERLVRNKIWYFTIGCGAVGGVILLSLLFATCFCRSIPSSSDSRKNSQQQLNHQDSKKQSSFILNQTTNAQQQHTRQHHHR